MNNGFDAFAALYLQNRDLSNLKRILGFDAEVEKRLGLMAPVIKQNIGTIIEQFYGFVLANPQAVSFFRDQNHIEYLKKVNTASFQSCFKPPFDEKYFLDRLKVGWVHAKIDLPCTIYFAAILQLKRIIDKVLEDEYKADHDELMANMKACHTMLNAEACMTIESFFLAKSLDLKSKHQQIEEILNNLSEGFVSINSDFKFGNVVSKANHEIWQQDLRGANLGDLEALAEESKKYLESSLGQVFEDFMPLEVTLSLLPKTLKSVDDRTLQLDYKAILDENNKPEKVILVTNDVTEGIKEKQRLERQAAKNEAVIGILKNLDGFYQFADDSRLDLLALKKSTSKEEIARILHTIKGNSASFGLQDIVDLVHQIESEFLENPHIEKVGEYVSKITTSFEHFMEENLSFLDVSIHKQKQRSYVFRQSDFDYLNDIIASLPDSEEKKKLSSLSTHIERVPIYLLAGGFEATVQRLGEKLSKDIKFRMEGGDHRVKPEHVSGIFKNLIHAVRNACDHGIELPEEREDQGKTASATITLSTSIENEGVRIKLSDDGRGIDVDKLTQKGLEKGLITAQDVDRMPDEEKLMLIFSDGVSTKEDVSDVSGRGVGLAALKFDVESMNGSISVRSKLGAGTDIEIFAPFPRSVA